MKMLDPNFGSSTLTEKAGHAGHPCDPSTEEVETENPELARQLVKMSW